MRGSAGSLGMTVSGEHGPGPAADPPAATFQLRLYSPPERAWLPSRNRDEPSAAFERHTVFDLNFI